MFRRNELLDWAETEFIDWTEAAWELIKIDGINPVIQSAIGFRSFFPFIQIHLSFLLAGFHFTQSNLSQFNFAHSMPGLPALPSHFIINSILISIKLESELRINQWNSEGRQNKAARNESTKWVMKLMNELEWPAWMIVVAGPNSGWIDGWKEKKRRMPEWKTKIN